MTRGLIVLLVRICSDFTEVLAHQYIGIGLSCKQGNVLCIATILHTVRILLSPLLFRPSFNMNTSKMLDSRFSRGEKFFLVGLQLL